MPLVRLPQAEELGNDKETIKHLIDIISRYRKELQFLLMNLDTKNIPMMQNVVDDVEGNKTAITQTSQDINLLAQDISGNQASINVNANAITNLVTDVDGNKTSITQNADSITSLVSDVENNQTSITQNASAIISKASKTELDSVEGRVTTNESSITQNANNITSKVSSTDYNGANIVSMINQTADTIKLLAEKIEFINATTENGVDDYVRVRQNYLEFIDYVDGVGDLTKLAIGFRPIGDAETGEPETNEPVIILGAGSGNGSDVGYITKDKDSLDIFYDGSNGSSLLQLKSDGFYIDGTKFSTQTDTNTTLSDAMTYTDGQLEGAITNMEFYADDAALDAKTQANLYTDSKVSGALNSITVTAKFA